MKPHKHAELIKAWADGAEIQWQDIQGNWETGNPLWNEATEYRIKPEPKPDVVKTCEFWYDKEVNEIEIIEKTYVPNLKLTFDGETGELKSAEVLK